MASATLPAVARHAAHVLGETLSARTVPLAREDAAELVRLCSIIGEMFAGFLHGVNESLARGVGSRPLRAKLTEGIAAAEETIRECAGLQNALAGNGASLGLVEALRDVRNKVERVREELTSILGFTDNPPAVPSRDKLDEAAKGPFVPMRN